MPDGRLVVPGGCQPSYPPNVQPATVRGPDGSCKRIECHLRCLPEASAIRTPRGDVPVSSLVPGDIVFTADCDGRPKAVPLLQVSQVKIEAEASMVVVVLADGRVTRASPGHPDAHGVPLEKIVMGASIDGANVVELRRETYRGGATWDILPAGPTGTYWSDGVLLGSTLHQSAEGCPRR
jgi:hypothetical protein